MMAQPILHQQFKIFNMKLYFIILNLFVSISSFAQIMPVPFIVNNNAYPTTISANTSFNIESATSGLNTNQYPAIISDFSWSFNSNSPYTIQFWVTRLDQNGSNRGFIGFTNASDGLSYSPESVMFYEFSGGRLKNFIKSGYLNALPYNYFEVGTPYQVTTVYTGSDWINYVNGEFVSASFNGSSWSGTGKLMIGNVGGHSNIKIDEVRFWDKEFTASELERLWNKPLTGNEEGLKLYYNFNDQGYADENNAQVKYLKDKSVNNNKGTFSYMSLSGTQQNFVTDITQLNIYDSVVLTVDPNVLDSYPGNDHGTDYGNTNNKSAAVLHDLNSPTNLIFYNNLSYNENQLASPILTNDGGRSLLINNIYGKTNAESNISGNDHRSFEVWVKLNSLNNNSIVSIGTSSNFSLYEMAVDNGKLLINIGPNFSSKLNVKSNRTLQTNTWYHIVVDYDNSNLPIELVPLFTIYINGVIDNNWLSSYLASQTNINPYSQTFTTDNTSIYIGNSLRSFNGKLGMLNVYKRVLTATEILNRFNVTKSRFGY